MTNGSAFAVIMAFSFMLMRPAHEANGITCAAAMEKAALLEVANALTPEMFHKVVLANGEVQKSTWNPQGYQVTVNGKFSDGVELDYTVELQIIDHKTCAVKASLFSAIEH